MAGGSAGRAELLVLGLGVRSLWPCDPQVEIEPNRGGRGQGPAPRPAAAPGGSSLAARPTLGPGGSGPPARRGPLRGGGRAHLPPGRLLRDFSKLPLAEDIPQWLPPLLSCTSLLPPLSPLMVVPAQAGATDFCRRGAVTVLPTESALFFSKEKSRGGRI